MNPQDVVGIVDHTLLAPEATKEDVLALLDEAGIEIHDDTEEEEIERFREFLDDVTPEDFEHGSTS